MSEVTVAPDPGSPTGGIQEAIDDLLTVGNGGTVKVPKADYQITQPIVVGKPGQFTEVWLRGLGGEGPWELSGPRLYPQFDDQFVIGVQGGRATKISGIWMQGPNQSPPNKPVADESLWNSIGSTSQHKPFTGIAIDPFSGGNPGNGYTPPPGWGWNERHSSAVHIDRCGMYQFISGVTVKPSGGPGADQNADFVRVTDSNISRCKFAITANGSQTRLTRASGCGLTECWVALAARVFGPKTGSEFYVKDSHFDYSGFLLWNPLTNGTASTIEDCYGEAMGGMISCGGSRTTHGAVSIRGGRFHFRGIWQGQPDIGLVWPYHFTTVGTTLCIEGTQFQMDWHPDEIRRHLTFWLDRHEPVSQSWLSLIGVGINTYSSDSVSGATDRSPFRDDGYLRIVRTPAGNEPLEDKRADQVILNCRACDAATNPTSLMAWPIPNNVP